MKARLLTFIFCIILCTNLLSQSAAVWNNGSIDMVTKVDSTEVISLEGKPYLRIWSYDRLVYSDYADSLQYFPVGEYVIIPVTSILLSSSELSIQLGHSETLIPTVLPENATDKTVTWMSSDESVASVKDGVVTANKLGTATITATAGAISAECQITVLPIEVTSVTLDKSTAGIVLGNTTTLTATVLPENATDKTVTWTTSDESVASVKDGVVTANKLGTATITATAGAISAECQITVLPVEVTSVTLDRTTASIVLGNTTTLTATVLPANATDKTVTWMSSDESVASVKDGVVTANKIGTATITATAGAISAECQITVLPVEVTSVTLDRTTASIVLGNTTTLTATVLPENATDKTVTWMSSDESVASVKDGVVTANKIGTATVTATAGTISAECQITVLPVEVTSVTLDRTTASIVLGNTTTLTATVLPENATDKTVTWTTTDASVASVNDGVVTANKLGTATITATAGTKSAECQIIVLPIEVTSVTLDITNLELTEGDSKTLTATITPNNATNKNITWSSSNNAIVTVDQSGRVTAVKSGSAIITATTEDGGKTATCYITVEKKPNVENPEEGEDWDW